MDVTVGTFSLNNLFGRWNLYVEVPETRALPGTETPAAIEPPRDWLEEAPGLAGTRGATTRDAAPPDVEIVIEGDIVPGGIKWHTNPVNGTVVFRKSAEIRRVEGGEQQRQPPREARRDRTQRRRDPACMA